MRDDPGQDNVGQVILESMDEAGPEAFRDYFKARYGPTITAQANARKNDREDEFNEALDQFCDEWNRGTPDDARFEKEYLIAVGTRA